MQTSSNKKMIRNFFDFIGLWSRKPLDQNPHREPLIDLTTDKQTWELFQYFRGEIKHEYALLTGRVTWYITCQSFLLTVYAISYANCRGHNWFSNIFLPLFSFFVSLLALNMIQGAITTILMWSDMRKHLITANPRLNSVIITRWRHPENNYDAIHARSLWFPKLIPMLFMVAWILIAILSWAHPWLLPLPT
jgi:hypothetical protein